MRASESEPIPSGVASSGRPSNSAWANWAQLLIEAVKKPGIISAAYSRFWNYSVGNQILALIQCLSRGLEPGPIHTFKGWHELGRRVKKGEKALVLCMPISVKRRTKSPDSNALPSRDGDRGEGQNASRAVPDSDGKVSVTVFTYKPRWFVLSQTTGRDYVPVEVPQWSEADALNRLLIDRIRFDHLNGNCQGYARERSVAVSPVAVLPHKTLFHELAHVLLGHTQEVGGLDDHDLTPVNVREVEAECVALICCESLNLHGAAECRGYIQHWLGKESISDRSAQRIFKAADQILKAGIPSCQGDSRE